MNITKNSILNKIVTMIIVITMTIGNFVPIGEYMMSYAIDMESVGENVQMAAYFIEGEEEKTKIEKEIDKTANLKIDIAVKNEGYFEGKISLKDSNFKIKSIKDNLNIKSNNEKEIEINRITAGSKLEIEVEVENDIPEAFERSLLSKETKIAIEGTYTKSKDGFLNKENTESKKIEGERRVQISYNAPTEIDTEVASKIITKGEYRVDGELKKITQIEITSKIKDNNYPAEKEVINIDVPEEAEVEVNAKEIEAVGAKYEYTIKDRELVITTKNEENEEGKIIWNRNAENKYIITFKSDVEINASEIQIIDAIDPIGGERIVKRTTSIGQDNQNGIIKAEKEIKEEIYKGKLYTGEEREYKEKTKIEINYVIDANEIEVTEKEGKYTTTEGEQEAQVEYKKTIINKEEVIDKLGEEGKLEIYNKEGTKIGEIDKNSEADENGKIEITYEEGIEEIIIKLSSPEKQGKIELEHIKAIKNEGKTREETRKITGIREEIEVKYKDRDFTNVNVKDKELKETTSEAKVETNKKTLTTKGTNEGLQIRTTLLTQGEDKTLYKNPTIKITFPEEIEKIENAKCKLIYGGTGEEAIKLEELNIDAENGRKVLTAELQGEQKQYSGAAIEGIILLFEGDIKVNRLSTSQEENIKIEITNKNEEGKIEKQEEIKIINPNAIITESDEEKRVELDIASGEKEETISILAKNNEGAEINNVTIIGEMPVNSTKNNVGITISEGIRAIKTSEAVATNEDIKIYYTENEEATEDINEVKNGWQEEAIKNAKKYQIRTEKLGQGESIVASYKIKIPAELKYNVKAETKYIVKYIESRTNTPKEIEAGKNTYTTGAGAELLQEVVASVGDNKLEQGAEVKAGEIITYNIKLTNKGNAKAEGIKVQGTVPEGTIRVVLTEKVNQDEVIILDDQFYDPNNVVVEKVYEEKDDEIVIFDNITLDEGKSINLSYDVKVKENIRSGAQATCKIITTYNNQKLEDEINNRLQISDLDISIQTVQRLKAKIQSGYSYDYLLKIKNNSDNNKQNVKVKFVTNELLQLKEISYDYNEGTVLYNNNIPEELVIEKINSRSAVNILISATVQNTKENLDEASIAAEVTYGNDLYRSNVIKEKVETIKLDMQIQSKNETNPDESYIMPGDTLKYTITTKNIGEIDANKLVIKDKMINYLTVDSVKLNNQDVSYEKDITFENENNYSTLSIESPLSKGETSSIEILAKVNDIKTNELLKVTNTAFAYNYINLAKVEGETYLIGSQETEKPIIISEIDAEKASKDNNTKKYTLSGTVWFDEDKNGERTVNEKLLEGINIHLLNSKTNEFVFSTTSDDEGFYSFKNIEDGEYMVVFEYDTGVYMPTSYQAEGVAVSQNSDAIQGNVKLNDSERTVAITDNMKLNKNLSNIDLGLIKAEKFDLELNKYVSKITVSNSHETKTYSFNKATLEKIEIAAKYLKNSNVIIEYTVELKNNGELSGYAQSIVDYKSSALDFSSNLNKDWYQSGEYLYNDSLSKTELKAGETKQVTLILTKTMTESNTGLINNTAEIAKVYNQSGISDIDSTPGNKQKGEDDLGSADVIIGVKTGAAVSYLALTISILVILAGGAYLINKKILNSKIKI